MNNTHQTKVCEGISLKQQNRFMRLIMLQCNDYRQSACMNGRITLQSMLKHSRISKLYNELNLNFQFKEITSLCDEINKLEL